MRRNAPNAEYRDSNWLKTSESQYSLYMLLHQSVMQPLVPAFYQLILATIRRRWVIVCFPRDTLETLHNSSVAHDFRLILL